MAAALSSPLFLPGWLPGLSSAEPNLLLSVSPWVVGIFLVWSLACAWLAECLGNRFMVQGLGRLASKAALIVVLVPLPVIDELLHQPVFETSCSRLAEEAPAVPVRGRLARLLGAPVPLTFSDRCPSR